MNKVIIGILLFVVSLLLGACSGGMTDSSESSDWTAIRQTANAMPTATMAPMPPMSGESSRSGNVGYGGFGGSANDVSWEALAEREDTRHVIQRANLELLSEHFNDTVSALRRIAPDIDGYIESEMLTLTGTPRFTIVLRVPSSRFDDVLRHIETLATVRTQNQWAEDVTDHFFDMAAHVATRRIEEERILALIAQATDIHELLALESRLSSVRQTIESYLTQLNQMAGQIEYSTIIVTLTCSAQPVITANATLGERIGGAFGDSVDSTVRVLQNIVVFFAGALIPLLVAGLIGLLVWRVVKGVRRKQGQSFQVPM
jgi:hypothetical protein